MLRQVFYAILPYRSFFVPILVVSSIIVPLWLVLRLYLHRTRGRPLSLSREILLLAFVLYLSGLAAVTLEPNRSTRYTAEATRGLELRPDLRSLTCATVLSPNSERARGFCVRNARGNLLLFFPLGVMLPLVSTRLRFWRGLQIAIAVSASIEVVQYISRTWGVNRTADINDFILNVLGATIGLAVVFLLRWRPGATPTTRPSLGR